MAEEKFLCNARKLKSRRRELRESSTDAEKKLWSKIRRKQIHGLKFFRQYSVGQYILDFYCPALKLAIELDGGQHSFNANRRYDLKRNYYLNKQGVSVLRFWNNDVLSNIDGVVLRIIENINYNPS